MSTITIRTATTSDLAILRAFEQGVIAVERPFDPTIKPAEIHYYDLPAMIAASDVELLVAEAEGVVVGSGYARLSPSRHYLIHSSHAYLGFMYVEPAYRGKGINTAIIEALREWAHGRGITELRLDVYHQNIRAIKAYEKAGFSQYLLNMRREV